MIDRTDEEVQAEVHRAWKRTAKWSWEDVEHDDSPDHLTVEVDRSVPGRVTLLIHSMYDPPGLTVAQLDGLARFFGAAHAGDAYGDHALSGCETCDYGSEYGFHLDLWGDA